MKLLSYRKLYGKVAVHSSNADRQERSEWKRKGLVRIHVMVRAESEGVEKPGILVDFYSSIVFRLMLLIRDRCTGK